MNYSALYAEYTERLTEKILPFWIKHGFDRKNGGMYTGLDRDGTLLESDKSVWFQGRALWTFATAYIEAKSDPEYLNVCESLIRFIEKYCFDTEGDGRMYFRVTADGKPVVKRMRYFFSETFAVVGFAAYSRASGKKEYAEKAFNLFKKIDAMRSSDILVPKFDQRYAPSKGFGVPMILLNVTQELLKACPEQTEYLTSYIDSLLAEMHPFIKPDLKLVLEQTAPDGSLMSDHFEGRLLNPGHAIEGSWFIMNEGRRRNAVKTGSGTEQIKLGGQMLDWMWDIGWDKEYGGIIYFRDALGKSATEYWHDMKFWWPQNEAAIANLMAFQLTGEKKYADRFEKVHYYVHGRFADDEYGEWFGYFHRAGTLSTPLKGNMYKGPFHVPRMYLVCAEILGKLK